MSESISFFCLVVYYFLFEYLVGKTLDIIIKKNLHENVTFILAKDVVAEHELPARTKEEEKNMKNLLSKFKIKSISIW